MATIKLASPTKFKSAPPATVPVFIENTRELTGFDLEQGASLTLAHLRGMVARKLGVAPSTVTCKLYKNTMDLNMRLCQIPDGVVVQVYTTDERYESGLMTNTNTNSSVTTPLSTGRQRLDNANNVTFANQSQVTAIYNAENAPTKVEKGQLAKLPKFNPNEKYAGTQANVDLTQAGPENSSPSSRNNKNGNNTSIRLNKADGSTISLARKEEPKRNLTRDVTIKVALEGGAPTSVTVANDTTVTDLRIRCNVEISEFPTSMCGDRRILVEQTSFKELCVGDGATLTFSTRTPQDWGDSDASEEMTAGATRYTKSSGGKNMSLANSSAFAKSPRTTTTGNQNTSMNNYSSSRETAYATSFYNNMNNNNNNNNTNTQNSYTSPSVNRSGRVPPPQYLDHQQYDPVPTAVHNNVGAAAAFLSAMNPQDLLNQSTKSESSAYGAPILSPQRPANSGTASRASSTSKHFNQQQNSFVPNSPSNYLLAAPHVSPVTPHYNNNNSFAYQQPSYAYNQNNETGNNQNNNNSQNRTAASRGSTNVVVYPNPNAMSIDQQISFFNSNDDQQQQSYAVPGEPIIVQPIGGPQRIGSAMTDKNFSLINVNNSARGKAYYSPGSADEMRIQEENTDFTGSSPARRHTNDNSTHSNNHNNNNRTTFATSSVRAVITPAQQRNASLRDRFTGAKQKSSLAGGQDDDLALRPLPDSPSHKNWISHNLRSPIVTQRSSEEDREAADRCLDAVTRGVFLNIRFEDPTDDHFTHELRVWSLHPCSFLFSFAGDSSEEAYHLLCDGQIILYPSANFGAVTKGVDQCLFSFARKQ